MEDTKHFANWSCSLSESAALWERVPFRTLQSWTSGQTLRIKPSRGRGKYGVLSQIQFGLASVLLKAGLPSKGVQVFLDNFAASSFLPNSFAERMKGRFIVCEDPNDHEHVIVHFFKEDGGKFWLAVKLLIEQTPLRFATIHLDSMLCEVLGRITAWNDRREYVSQGSGEQIKKALREISEFNLEHGLPANTPSLPV
ncbi:MAG: hypothetical protein JWQ87_2652 [Candidatus Sulfotelmatobacter sp.]|nr:hypothetical protein [Candidatus Sulfotelmatobacter sp.]